MTFTADGTGDICSPSWQPRSAPSADLPFLLLDGVSLNAVPRTSPPWRSLA